MENNANLMQRWFVILGSSLYKILLSYSRVMSNIEGCDLAIQFGLKFTETSPGKTPFELFWRIRPCVNSPPKKELIIHPQK